MKILLILGTRLVTTRMSCCNSGIVFFLVLNVAKLSENIKVTFTNLTEALKLTDIILLFVEHSELRGEIS